ncbi:hypothetical protein F6B41_23455 [Microbacterium lushaniae]|nr:hypothetical protein F6B41_23455 [Microbacterium lushaniae]
MPEFPREFELDMWLLGLPAKQGPRCKCDVHGCRSGTVPFCECHALKATYLSVRQRKKLPHLLARPRLLEQAR